MKNDDYGLDGDDERADDDYDKDADDILICLETLCSNEEDGYIDHHIT